MDKKKYSIGIDFGTLSGRAVLVDVENGREILSEITTYRDGVIDHFLPGTDIKLPHDWALQNPENYMEVLTTAVPKIIHTSGIDKENIIAIGIDFTGCTILPVKKDGTPLCYMEEYRKNPHAWVKLWKHHAAQTQANRLNELATKLNEGFLKIYGGKISSEWFVPKVMQILEEAPEIYAAADRFTEASDWIVMQLTGIETRNNCAAGYKALWHHQQGYPGQEFYRALDSRLENFVDEKLGENIVSVGTKAGELTEKMAEKMMLKPGTPVAAGILDAHAAVPAMNAVEAGKMVMVMGTSLCHFLVAEEEKAVKGICGVVKDGIITGLYGYEAGQAAVGDILQWFVENCVPAHYIEEAQKLNITVYRLLEEKASVLKPGESGLLALDWWNGNRSVLVDADLTGTILGLTLATKPEEIYRALIEATAFGTRMIIEVFREAGIPVNKLYACGGLAQKDKMLVQIYCDVMNMEISLSDSQYTCALGAAIHGAVAAGKKLGGYDSIFDAAEKMGRLREETFKPIPENVETYRKLYVEYKKLHDYFGRGGNDVMKLLKSLKIRKAEFNG
jgi:L-ribulokinase